jgi:hypothetical protein
MNIFLDDQRLTPKGWTRCFWPNEVIDLMSKNKVEFISLDHDLGSRHTPEITGYTFLELVEQLVFDGKITSDNLPLIVVHSSNPVGIKKMLNSIESIHNQLGLEFKRHLHVKDYIVHYDI